MTEYIHIAQVVPVTNTVYKNGERTPQFSYLNNNLKIGAKLVGSVSVIYLPETREIHYSALISREVGSNNNDFNKLFKQEN